MARGSSARQAQLSAASQTQDISSVSLQQLADMGEGEPKKPDKPPPAADPNAPLELFAWWLPYIMATSGSSSFQIGSLLNSGTEVSGIVRRIQLMPTGYVRVGVQAVVPSNPNDEDAPLRWMVFLEGHGVER